MYRCGQPYWSIIPPVCPGCPICTPKCCMCPCCRHKPDYKIDFTEWGKKTELSEESKKIIRDCIEKLSKDRRDESL